MRSAARRRVLVGLAALATLAGAARGAPPRPDFALQDAAGRTRRLSDFRGRAVALAFGFTHCPDVCPTTLAMLAEAMRQLGPQAQDVRVLFVTVDPKRDTAAVLGRYVTAFDPAFVALRGDAGATKRAADAFEVTATVVPGRTPDSYTVDHTAAVFLLDDAGFLRFVIGHDRGPAAVVRDLRRLLAAAPSRP